MHLRNDTSALKSALLALVCVALAMATSEVPGIAQAPMGGDDALLNRHLGTAMSQMDKGAGSREYRESLAFLRAHAVEALAQVSGLLLDDPGSFGKWQVTYLVGEFGDESAIALLGLLIDEPLSQPRSAREGSHEIDLVYAEELASHVQAVMSTARIATHRPDLRAQVVAELVATAREVPLLKGTALFELRKLLGPEFQTLRHYFGEEDARHFVPFMPPPEWQALLRRRMQEHQRQEQRLKESRQPLCHRE